MEKRLGNERDMGGEDATYGSIRELGVRATGEVVVWVQRPARIGLGEGGERRVDVERVGCVWEDGEEVGEDNDDGADEEEPLEGRGRRHGWEEIRQRERDDAHRRAETEEAESKKRGPRVRGGRARCALAPTCSDAGADHVRKRTPVTCGVARRRCLCVVWRTLFAGTLSSQRPPPTHDLARPLPMAAQDGPVLALDDIMHTMSPSPAPQTLPPDPGPSTLPAQTFSPITNGLDNGPLAEHIMPPPRMPSPESLDHPELESMRARVQQYTLTLDSANQRESELAAMVCSFNICAAILS